MRWLTFAIQNTLRNRRRSLVTVAIAALGTAAILLASGSDPDRCILFRQGDVVEHRPERHAHYS